MTIDSALKEILRDKLTRPGAILDPNEWIAFRHAYENRDKRYMQIRPLWPTGGAWVFAPEDVTIKIYRSRVDEPGNVFLHCKCCLGALWIADSDFAEYKTLAAAEAALKIIREAFTDGADEIFCPREGLYMPYDDYRGDEQPTATSATNSTNRPRKVAHAASETNLFSYLEG